MQAEYLFNRIQNVLFKHVLMRCFIFVLAWKALIMIDNIVWLDFQFTQIHPLAQIVSTIHKFHINFDMYTGVSIW